jgi:preprotein translocase subunit SecD
MFQKITKAEYERGKIASGLAGAGSDRNSVQQYAGHSAIVLDNQLQSTPYIDYTDAQLQNGIAGGAQITTGSQSEAKNLALILQTGALPVSFKQIERTEVSATLGKESLTQAWHAAAVGLIAVAIFCSSSTGSSASSPSSLAIYAPLLRGDPALQRDAHAAGLRRLI